MTFHHHHLEYTLNGPPRPARNPPRPRFSRSRLHATRRMPFNDPTVPQPEASSNSSSCQCKAVQALTGISNDDSHTWHSPHAPQNKSCQLPVRMFSACLTACLPPHPLPTMLCTTLYMHVLHTDHTSSITDTCRSFTYTPRTLSMRYRRVAMRANYHPFLFTLMTLTAAAELGLTAFLISAGNEARSWSSSGYHSLLILLCFSSAWTLLFSTAYVLWMVDGAVHLLAQVASSAFWLLLTSILWGLGAGFMHNARSGGNCAGHPPISRCRQTLTVEALGWTEFSLCCVTLIATLIWMRSGLGKKKLSRDSRTFV